MLLESELAKITLAFWTLSKTWEGKLDSGITFEMALGMTQGSLVHLNPERRIAHSIRRLEQAIITGNPIQDKVIADASR